MARARGAPQHFAVLPLAFGHQRVRRIEHALRRTVVLFERDDRRRQAVLWRVLIGKAEDVVDRRGPKRIDRLRIVADDGHAVAVLPQTLQDLRLQHVRVLILVDEDVIELRRRCPRRAASSLIIACQ